MKYDVRELPLDLLLKFDNNKYIMNHKSYRSLSGLPIRRGPIELTYIFEINDGVLDKAVCGRVVDKRVPYDINKEFMFVDYDNEETYEYDITMTIRELDSEEMNMVSEAIKNCNGIKKDRNK